MLVLIQPTPANKAIVATATAQPFQHRLACI